MKRGNWIKRLRAETGGGRAMHERLLAQSMIRHSNGQGTWIDALLAQDAAERACRMRGDREAGREVGVVASFNAKKGYGFISRQHGPDAFVHQEEIQTPGYRTLTPGQVVELTVCSTPKGPHARRVVPR